MRHTERHQSLAASLRRVLVLLEQVEPEREDTDVLWAGPFLIAKRKQWWPTSFLRYRNELYSNVEIGWSMFTLVWNVDTDEVAFEGESSFGSGYQNGPALWEWVLKQVEPRLRGAIANPAVYNRRVARLLPVGCRKGRIPRKLTWPKTARRPLSREDLVRLERALELGKGARSWRSLSVRRYLEVAALAYDSVFADLKELTPLEKYKRKADPRHGGMLDLGREDSRAFERWHSSREWSGAHPWEIVFAHPHGILLSPHRDARTWRLFLSVDTLGLYLATARMAIALGEGGVPFELWHAAEISAALRGEDWVEVGPFYGQLSLEELEDRRKGASAKVAWDAPPILSLRKLGSEPRSRQP